MVDHRLVALLRYVPLFTQRPEPRLDADERDGLQQAVTSVSLELERFLSRPLMAKLSVPPADVLAVLCRRSGKGRSCRPMTPASRRLCLFYLAFAGARQVSKLAHDM